MRRGCSAAWMLAAVVTVMAAAGCSERSQPGEVRTPRSRGDAAGAPGQQGEQMPRRPEVAGAVAGEGEVVTSVALPTGDRATSLLLVEHVGPEPGRVRAGEEFSYRIRLTNLSQSCALESLVVRQHLAAGLEVVGAQPASAGREGEEQVWRLDALGPGQSAEIRATGVVPSASAASQSAAGEQEMGATCVRVSYAPALCAPLAVAPARVELVREAPEEWSVCDLLPVTYRITNRSDEPLGPLVIREALAEGLVGGSGPRGEVEIRVPGLAPGETHEEMVQLRALRPGAYAGRAAAVLEDGARVWSASAVSTAAQAALAVTVDAPEVAHAGEALRYAVAVTNSGNGIARGARVQVRAGALADASGGGPPQSAEAAVRILDPVGADVGEGFAVVPLGDIAPGTTAYASFTLARAMPGELVTSVEVVAPCIRAVDGERDEATGQEHARARVATRLIAATPITLDVRADPNPVAVGNEVVFQIMLINQSGTQDRNVSVGVLIPPGLEVIEAMGQTDPRQVRGGDPEGERAAAGEGGRILFEPLDRLLPGQRANWYIRAAARERGEYRVAVEVTSDGLPRPLAEIEPAAVR